MSIGMYSARLCRLVKINVRHVIEQVVTAKVPSGPQHVLMI